MARPDWVSGYIGSQPSLGPSLVCDGNSMTVGIGASGAATYYPAQLATLLGVSWTVSNAGTSSETTQNRINVAATNILANLDLTRSKNLAILWEATNEIYYWLLGSTPPSGAAVPANLAAVEANTQAWCALARSYDFKVIVGTVLPRSNAGMSAQNITDFATQRALYNTWLRANYTSFADGLIDFAAISGMGEDGDEEGANYSADRVHPNDDGYALIAAAAYPVVAAMSWTATP
jgi:lysophospholipase L1-like esterase